jgi:hydrogenase expression/formation protein HypC
MCIAIPGAVVSLGTAGEISYPGRVSILGDEREIDLVMVPDVEIGDYVVVHSGYAIEIVPQERARRTLELLSAEVGEVDRSDGG